MSKHRAGTLRTISEPSTTQSALVFDYGKSRIGVAYANRVSGSATPLTTLLAKDSAAAERAIKNLVAEWQPDALVIGVPYNMDGTESGLTSLAINFGTHIAALTGLPVKQVDERLTSSEAQMLLKEQRRTGQRRKKIRREDIDSLAAGLIAETWLRETE